MLEGLTAYYIPHAIPPVTKSVKADFARNKIGPFSIVVFRAKLKKVEIFSTFLAEN